jgi:mannose-6-phosphate isomerase-like protein (cupin superfamily)
MSDEVTTARLGVEPGERFASLRRALGVVSFGMNQIVLGPGQRNRIHRHQHQEEIYLVLEGILTLVIEGQPYDYDKGELVRVAPAVRRQLVNRHREPLSIIALGGFVDHEHGGRDGEAFADWTDTEPGTPQTVPAPADLAPSELLG